MTQNELAVFEDRLRQQAAERLVTCAVTLQSEEMGRLSIANPYPHKNPAPQGEYPRARTFTLRNGVQYDSTTLDVIKKELRVRVGYAARAFYGAILQRKGWKGLLDTLKDLRPRFVALLANLGTAREV